MTLRDLEPLIGTWDTEARFPPGMDVPPVEGDVSTRFEWTLDGAFLLQTSVAPAPIPNGLMVIAWEADHGRYRQHYFDSRGVVRTYAMSFDGRTWTLERTGPDFSPFDFAQRYTGTFSDDGRTITGGWEICHDGTTWEHDFELTYTKR